MESAVLFRTREFHFCSCGWFFYEIKLISVKFLHNLYKILSSKHAWHIVRIARLPTNATRRGLEEVVLPAFRHVHITGQALRPVRSGVGRGLLSAD